MKIVLTAFNQKLWSKPMEVPDNTSPDFYMPLPLDILAYNLENNSYETSNLRMKRGQFRRTNKSFSLKDLTGQEPAENEDPFIKEYVLVDIS